MILYPKDQKEAVIRKIRTLLSDPNIPRGAFSQLAKEEQIPKATIYVSCDGSTLNRDLELLSEKYDVATITPLDLFPQSEHLEYIAVLEPKR